MRIALIVDSMQRHLFFSKLANALKHEHQIFFASSEPLSVLMARMEGFSAKHLSRKVAQSKYFSTADLLDITEKSIEVLNGLFSATDSSQDAASISDGLYEYLKQNEVDKVIIWNGQQLLGRAASLAAGKAGIKAQYLELANLPGKLFSDPQGVNALSSIAHNIEIIDRLPEVPEEIHQSWLKSYELSKQKPLPQSQRKLKNTILSAVNIILKKSLKSTCAIDIKKRKTSTLSHQLEQTSVPPHTNDYIFLALQVSSDTQIKLHSNHDNIDAIHISREEATRAGLDLIVKIHPAENSPEEISRIVKAQKSIGFIISSDNTIDLLKKAHTVITINSTVGLEALLFGKRVKTLGRCFYKNFDNVRIKKYIHHYLIDEVNYFDNSIIQTRTALQLIGA